MILGSDESFYKVRKILIDSWTVFSVVLARSRGSEAEVETTVAGVRFDLGPGVGREGLSLRDPAAGLVDYSHWLTALRYSLKDDVFHE